MWSANTIEGFSLFILARASFLRAASTRVTFLKCNFQGNDGDDYLVLGLRSGRVVHRFNLGSGVATIVSDQLDLRLSIHSVTFGRSGKTGWLKVIWSLVSKC